MKRIEAPLSPATWIAVMAMAVAVGSFTWIFRRIVTLFAALDASERLEDNAPARASRPTMSSREGGS